MTRLSDLYGKLLDALAVIAALLLLAMVIVVTGDIVLRNTVSKGFVWANEVSEYSLYLITLLTAPWLLRRGQHVRLDLVLTAVPRRIAWIMEAVGDIIGFVVCLGDDPLRHADDATTRGNRARSPSRISSSRNGGCWLRCRSPSCCWRSSSCSASCAC